MSILSLLKRLVQRLNRPISKAETERAEQGQTRPEGSSTSVDQNSGTAGESARREPTAARRERPVASSLIPVVIGLDFGTFSTKVVARRRNERTAVVVRLDEPCPGYPSFAIPSLIRVTEGKLFFGRCAAHADGGELFRSLKVSLLTGSHHNPGASLRCDDDLGVDRLVALYLAWVLGRVGKWLDAEYGPSRTNLFVNAAAPMDHYEHPILRERYLRIVNSAWNAVLGPRPVVLEQGTPLSSVRHWLDEYMHPRTEIEPVEIRRFDVLPETVAPIVSLSHDPRMRAGMHLIVDMGAGTTEFSVNHVPDPGGNQKLLCYYDQSILLGAEQFDSPAPGESEGSLTSSLLAGLRRTWGTGYLKDAKRLAARDRWKELTVLLAGGGTCRPGLRDKIARHRNSVMYAFQGHDCRYSVKTHIPADLEFRATEAEGQADAFLLSVAHGLSYARRTWPEFLEPCQIEHMGGTPQAARPDLPWFEVG